MQFDEARDRRIVFLDEGDYSHFERFCHKEDKWPGHLPRLSTSPRGNGPVDMVDIGLVLRESFSVADSSASPGLQLVDIVTNGFRRAVSGRLGKRGWASMGALMFKWRGTAVLMAHLAQDLPPHILVGEEPARSVVREMTRQARTPLDG
jgi:hypothetical protein